MFRIVGNKRFRDESLKYVCDRVSQFNKLF